jgi:hypothetical protein
MVCVGGYARDEKWKEACDLNFLEKKSGFHTHWFDVRGEDDTIQQQERKPKRKKDERE